MNLKATSAVVQMWIRATFCARARVILIFFMTAQLVWTATNQPVSPLTPEQELASFRLADSGLIIELVAVEPDVASPVAVAWDADGRMYVAEMTDYPNALSGGRIRLLENRDRSGRFKRVTVFADRLPFPNGVLPWNGGVLVTAAPDIWFFKDTDGDGKADEKRVLFTGFGEGNQQLRVNGLFCGLDNWIYGANGRSEGEIRRPGDPPDIAQSIRGHDFRFRPGTGEFQAIAGRSQFGQTRDDWGNRFLSWNTIPLRHEVLPERYLNRNRHLTSTGSLLDIFPPDDSKQVFQISPLPRTFNDEPFGYFNASCGPTIFRGTALGESYSDTAFVCEPLRNLVHRRVLTPNGVTFEARRMEAGIEFLASTDPWFHPVNLATGPDGALYVVDFYRQWVEHPEFVHNENIEKSVSWRTGADHGRIWRIRRRAPELKRARPELSRLRSTGLVKHLTNENGWWRDTAQRLLVERNDSAAVQPLQKMATQSPNPRSRVNALWTLEGLNALNIQLLLRALQDVHPRVRENAVRLCEPFLNGRAKTAGGPDQIAALIRTLSALVDDPDPRIRFQLALTLGELNSPERVVALAQLAPQVVADKWLSMALLSSVGDHPLPLLIRLLHDNPGWLDAGNNDQAQLLDQLAGIIGSDADEGELNEVMSILIPTASNPPSPARLSLLAGLADGLAKSNRSLRELTHRSHVYSSQWVQPVDVVIQYAIETADSDHAPLWRRLTAIRVLAGIEPTKAGPVLSNLMLAKHPVEVQMAATRALTEFKDAELAKAVFANWSQYTRKTRGQLLTGATRSTTFTAAMLDVLEEGRIAVVEISPYNRAALMKNPSAEIKQRAERLLQSTVSPDRSQVIQEFMPAVKLKGDRRHGAVLFAGTCFVCHSIQGHGNHVGPDLSGVGSHPKETLLVDLLDPNRQVSPDYLSYALVMTGGETVTGLIESETPVSVTVRRPSEPDQTIPRSQIKELRAEGRSLMPDGLEQGLKLQDVADLLEFLSQPDATLLPNQN